MKNLSNQRERVYQEIRDAITYGHLNPGERLIEEKICKLFKVGRTPLREALRQLQMEGCVEVLPNKGAIVSRLSVQGVEDIYDMIAILEAFATEALAAHVEPKDIETLLSIQNDLKIAGEKKDYKKWIEKNALFHGYFPALHKNRHLREMVDGLRKRVYRYRFIAITIPNHIEDYISDHKKVLEALANKDSEKAGVAMKRHVLYVKEVITRFLKDTPGF